MLGAQFDSRYPVTSSLLKELWSEVIFELLLCDTSFLSIVIVIFVLRTYCIYDRNIYVAVFLGFMLTVDCVLKLVSRFFPFNFEYRY